MHFIYFQNFTFRWNLNIMDYRKCPTDTFWKSTWEKKSANVFIATSLYHLKTPFFLKIYSNLKWRKGMVIMFLLILSYVLSVRNVRTSNPSMSPHSGLCLSLLIQMQVLSTCVKIALLYVWVALLKIEYQFFSFEGFQNVLLASNFQGNYALPLMNRLVPCNDRKRSQREWYLHMLLSIARCYSLTP